MDRRLLVALTAISLLGLLAFVSTRMSAAAPSTGIPPKLAIQPDLMVKWVSFDVQRVNRAQVRTIKVCIRNVGNGKSTDNKLGVYELHDVVSDPIGSFVALDVPPLFPGQQTVLTATDYGTFARTVFMVFVDCPVPDREFGQVSEFRSSPAGTTRPVAEANNALVCPIDPVALPVTIYHPGACCGGF